MFSVNSLLFVLITLTINPSQSQATRSYYLNTVCELRDGMVFDRCIWEGDGVYKSRVMESDILRVQFTERFPSGKIDLAYLPNVWRVTLPASHDCSVLYNYTSEVILESENRRKQICAPSTTVETASTTTLTDAETMMETASTEQKPQQEDITEESIQSTPHTLPAGVEPTSAIQTTQNLTITDTANTVITGMHSRTTHALHLTSPTLVTHALHFTSPTLVTHANIINSTFENRNVIHDGPDIYYVVIAILSCLLIIHVGVLLKIYIKRQGRQSHQLRDTPSSESIVINEHDDYLVSPNQLESNNSETTV